MKRKIFTLLIAFLAFAAFQANAQTKLSAPGGGTGSPKTYYLVVKGGLNDRISDQKYLDQIPSGYTTAPAGTGTGGVYSDSLCFAEPIGFLTFDSGDNTFYYRQ